MITPKFSLDFLTSVLDPRITFARTGATATRINSSGLIETVAADTPRFDYNPMTLACRGLLVEESRQNLWTYSEDFSNAAWLKTNATISSNATTAPDGTMTADKIIRSNGATTAENLVRASSTGFSNINYSASIFAKKAEWSFLRIYARNKNDTAAASHIDLNSGTVVLNNHDVTVEQLDDGWLRVSSIHRSSTGTLNVYYSPIVSNVSFGTGNGVDGIYSWGAQIEAGSFSTSYIPTTTAAITRNADVATITGANFSDWWQATRGGVLVRARPGTVSGVRPWLQFDDGTANEIIALRGSATNPELYIVDGGVAQAQIDAGTIAANTDYSLTGWWATNDCKARLNSGAVVADTSATIPTVTQARLGSDGTNYLNGHLASISYYDSFSEQIYTRRKNKAVFNLM